MTPSIRRRSIQPGRGPRVAAAAALAAALAGCSATHVGESWQCPLDQGGSCTSVEAADPAVPARAGEATGRVAGTSVSGEPLYRVRAEPEFAHAREAARAERPCDAACGPLAWLARLFGTETDADGGEPDAGSAAADAAARPGAVIETPSPLPASESPVDAGAAGEDMRPGGSAATDGAPVETGPKEAAGNEPAGQDSETDDLREPEVVGRIWIAPFVDGDGIYREGAYVRLVIAPARWRLP